MTIPAQGPRQEAGDSHTNRPEAPVHLTLFEVNAVKPPGQTAKLSISLSQNGGCPQGKFRSFRTDSSIGYEPFYDDFGPMSMLTIFHFVEALDEEIGICASTGVDQLVYCAGKGPRNFTNAAFLMGAYMLLKLNQKPESVNSRFKTLNPLLFEGYRDASSSTADFRLRLIDCWNGLYRGITLGWVAMPTKECPWKWGLIDKDAYAHFGNPLNADLHEVVPGKFIALRGPKSLGGPNFVNNFEKRCRDFDPKHFLPIFKERNVSAVIRLNEVSYPAAAFTAHGIAHHDLYFDDCTPPPPAVVKSFCQIADAAAGGLVAVHCRSGLGRTGTLIALYMMRSHGFSAREALGWVRIMRPGSVLGGQQHYLCKVEDAVCRRALALAQPEEHKGAGAGAADDLAIGTRRPASAEGGAGAGARPSRRQSLAVTAEEAARMVQLESTGGDSDARRRGDGAGPVAPPRGILQAMGPADAAQSARRRSSGPSPERRRVRFELPLRG